MSKSPVRIIRERKRGTTRFLIGSTPRTWSASSSSRILRAPRSAVIAAPAAPATTTAGPFRPTSRGAGRPKKAPPPPPAHQRAQRAVLRRHPPGAARLLAGLLVRHPLPSVRLRVPCHLLAPRAGSVLARIAPRRLRASLAELLEEPVSDLLQLGHSRDVRLRRQQRMLGLGVREVARICG